MNAKVLVMAALGVLLALVVYVSVRETNYASCITSSDYKPNCAIIRPWWR